MAFVLKQSDSYLWPVSFDTASDGGKHTRHTFDVEFRRISQSEINRYVNEAAEGERSDTDTCRELVMGWRGITDGAGEVPFSQGALDQLLDFPGAARAIIQAWGESLTGGPRKN